jgi:hypothetical protein
MQRSTKRTTYGNRDSEESPQLARSKRQQTDSLDGKLRSSKAEASSRVRIPAEQRENMANFLERLRDALEFLPATEKQEYLEALSTAPHLVTMESRLESFLCSANFVVGLAAMRLLSYWKFRKCFFQDRAFRPMSLREDSALQKSDFDLLASGFCVFLPDDQKGHAVLYVDAEKILNADMDALRRCLFYMLQVVTQNELSAKEGFVLVLLSSPSSLQNCLQFLTLLRSFLEGVMPTSIHRAFITHKPEDAQGREFVEVVIPSMVKVCGSEMGRYIQPVIAKDAGDLIHKLTTSGLKAEGIPTDLGGAWSLENHNAWWVQRENEELEMYTRGPSTATNANAVPVTRNVRHYNSIHEEFVETDVSVQRSLAQFFDALQMIPYAEKDAYLEALDKCPYLVETESDPIKFLRCESFKPWEAARRLVNYWRYRKIVMEDRAFLPMNLTGKGALRQKEIDFFKIGAVMCMKDSKGAPVMCFDRSKIPEMLDGGGPNVALFYLLTVFSDEEIGQREGCTNLVILSNQIIARPYRQSNHTLMGEVMHCASPVRMVVTHLVSIVSESEALTIGTAINKMQSRINSSASNYHIFKSKVDSLKFLKSAGMTRNYIPDSLGGSWSLDNAKQWLQQQTEKDIQSHPIIMQRNKEMILKASAAEINDGDALNVSSIVKKAAVAADDDQPVAPPDDRDMETRLEEALDFIPADDKVDYSHAKDRVPYLLELESRPDRFVACEKMDPWAAARRLVNYWERRKMLFKNKAYLPMNLTGEGTMGLTEIELANSGVLLKLPNDKDGRVMMFFDQIGLSKKEYTNESWMKCLFYWLQIASEDEASQSKGLVFLHYLNVKTFDRVVYRSIVDFLEGVLPIRVHAYHMICSPAEVKKQTFCDVIVPFAVPLAGVFHNILVTHIHDTMNDLLECNQHQ